MGLSVVLSAAKDPIAACHGHGRSFAALSMMAWASGFILFTTATLFSV